MKAPDQRTVNFDSVVGFKPFWAIAAITAWFSLVPLLHPAVAAQTEARNGEIVERKAYRFPTYDRAVKTTDIENYSERIAYDKAVSDTRFEFQKLTYISDGLKVTAYLYKPGSTSGARLPAIVFNRGSAVRGDIAPELVGFFHRLASEGFVILAPMLRQSDGGEGRDELGGADLNDVMNVVPLSKSLGFIDMNNLFMYGESRGGMMTSQAIKRAFPMNAAAVFGAFTSLQELVSSHPTQYTPSMLMQIWPDLESRRDEIFQVRSAALWADQLDIPLLIMHGGADKSVNPAHSLTLAQQLTKLGRSYPLIVYADDNHILAKNAVDRDQRAIGWFKRHLRR